MDMHLLIYKSNIYWVLLYVSTIPGIRNTHTSSSKSLSSIGASQPIKRIRDKWIIAYSVVGDGHMQERVSGVQGKF